jgi:AAA family ATP:ADP antiporter
VLLFIFQVARRGLHYAIDRPARETLYTITSVDEKYKSKAFIDTFVYRLGDQVGAWGTVGAYATLSAATALMTIAMPVAALWIGSALVLGRAYAKRASQERIEV